MSDYKTYQLIITAMDMTNKDNDPVCVVQNISIDEDVDERELKDMIRKIIRETEDRL